MCVDGLQYFLSLFMHTDHSVQRLAKGWRKVSVVGRIGCPVVIKNIRKLQTTPEGGCPVGLAIRRCKTSARRAAAYKRGTAGLGRGGCAVRVRVRTAGRGVGVVGVAQLGRVGVVGVPR